MIQDSLMIDNGSSACRAGFSNEEIPSVEIPSIEKISPNDNSYVGSNAQNKRDFDYPISRGIVNDYENLEKLWQHIFTNELKIDPNNYNVNLTVHNKSKKDRERMTELMFETFQAPGIYLSFQPLLSMYAANLFSGLSVCSGEGVTNIVPVYEGYVVPRATLTFNIAGCDLTEYLANNLNNDYPINVIREMKENSCYVSNGDHPHYELPDGEQVKLPSEAYRCAEVLFHPDLITDDDNGIHKIIYDSIKSSEIDIRKNLYGNIFLSGGNMLFPGMAERIHKELAMLAPPAANIQITTTEKGTNTVWVGGSILNNFSNFQNMWITKQDYDSIGLKVLNKLNM